MDAKSQETETKPKLTPATLAALEHERLASLINSMADGVIAIDDNKKVVIYNGAALNILDLNGSINGRKLSRIMPIHDQHDEPVNITQLIDSIRIPTSNRDYLLHYTDGSTVNLYLSIAPVYLGFGAKGDRGYVLLLRDITQEKSLEEERDEFISVVSHELRTPIAITEGNISNAQFIVDSSGDISEVRKALAAAHEQVLFLAGLVNDLSTLSRAERNMLDVNIEQINTYELVEDLAQDAKEQAKKKRLAIKTDLDPSLEVLQSSKLYVREILQNFITNSIKYTDHGSITIGAHSEPKGVSFTVSDTGIGISKGDQQKVFNKFYRSEDFRTRTHSGTGLGLYVTKKLARLIHASIEVESTLDEGSCFTVFVPNLQPTASDTGAVPAS